MYIVYTYTCIIVNIQIYTKTFVKPKNINLHKDSIAS